MAGPEQLPHAADRADELEQLLDRFCLGQLDGAGWRRLNDLIAGDEESARRYAQAAHYCQTLRDETAGDAGRASPLSAIGSGAATPPTNAAKATLRDPERGSGLTPWVFQLGLAVSVAFVAGWLASANWSEADATAGQLSVTRAPIPRAPTAPAVSDAGGAKRDPLGKITGLTPVASSDGLLRSLRIGTLLGRGEVVQLTQGAARLEIDGCELIVEGPAEVSAIDKQTVFVRQGRVTVPGECGVSVQTPVAMVSNDGGAFAVVADGDDGLVVCGLAGETSVLSSPTGGRVANQLDEVAAGDTVRVEQRSRRRVELVRDAQRPTDLLLAWDETLERLHPYERLVLSDNPLAYWPLYRVRRHRAVLDLTQNGFDGQAIGNWPSELSDIHASQVRGAYFDQESYIESDRKPPVDLRTGFTIEGWAKVIGGPEYQSVFTSRWVLASNTENEQCFGFTLYAGVDDKWQFWTGSGEYGENWQKLVGPAEVRRGEWTHVAATFEPDPGLPLAERAIGGVVRLYVDGEQVASDLHRMSLEDFEWPARIGAAEFVPRSLTSWLFRGELRDVALYDHVLPTGRIGAHAVEGRTAT